MDNRHFSPTRRRFLAGTAGTIGAAAVGGRGATAQDATPSASPVASPAAPAVEQPDMTGAAYQFQVGSYSCLAVSDGANTGGFGAFLFGNAPEDEVQQAVSEAGIDPSMITLQHTSVVIDTGSEMVLVDTGAGPAGLPTTGILVDNLRREGIQPADIDVVVLTHGHGDHIGGNVTATGNPLFSNARYVMSQEDWDFFTDPQALQDVYPEEFAQQQTANAEQYLLPIEDVFELIGYDEEIVPGVISIAAQGHTLGHMALRVESEGDQLWILGDAALHPIHLQYPEFTGLPDADPEQAVETRMSLFERIASEGGTANFNHFDPFPSLGTVATDGEAWSWEPVGEDMATPVS